ncbi:MAG: SH3 domain-containing protein, partial [Rhodothermales bacterium]|nr:SH3 domain-containing protein [Rhodothermales bacterium]
MYRLDRLLVLPLLLLVVPVAAAQSPSARPTSTADVVEPTESEGYLLAETLYVAPDATSERVPPLAREERVRIVAAESDEPGWYAVFRAGASTPVGYAFRPYLSRFPSRSPSSISAEGGAGGGTAGAGSTTAQPQQEASDEPLNEVTFPEGSTEGVLCVVERWTNVRSGPGLGYDAFGVIRPGVPFRVVDVERGWGQLMLAGDRPFGYVSGSLLRQIEEPETVAPETAEPAAPAPVGEAAGPPPTPAAPPAEVEVEAEVAEPVLTPQAVVDRVVYVTRHGRKFHRHDCGYLRSHAFALPLSEAQQDYAPCRV